MVDAAGNHARGSRLAVQEARLIVRRAEWPDDVSELGAEERSPEGLRGVPLGRRGGCPAGRRDALLGQRRGARGLREGRTRLAEDCVCRTRTVLCATDSQHAESLHIGTGPPRTRNASECWIRPDSSRRTPSGGPSVNDTCFRSWIFFIPNSRNNCPRHTAEAEGLILGPRPSLWEAEQTGPGRRAVTSLQITRYLCLLLTGFTTRMLLLQSPVDPGLGRDCDYVGDPTEPRLVQRSLTRP